MTPGQRVRCLLFCTNGDEYAEWAARNEIGLDELHSRATSEGVPIVTDGEEAAHGITVESRDFAFSTEEDRAQALALVQVALGHVSRDREGGHHRSCEFVALPASAGPREQWSPGL